MLERLKNNNRQGFTLVELALVLVIVGLLITGVLKGEALIQNAKVKKIVNEKDSIAAAYYTFFDRYGQLPGDENLTTAPPSDTNNGDGNGQINAAEDGYLFQDLSLAGIINGSYTGAAANVPNHAFGSWMRIQWVGVPAGSALALNTNCMVFNAVPPDVCEQIDRKYDDGVNNTGSIRASAAYGGTANLVLSWRL